MNKEDKMQPSYTFSKVSPALYIALKENQRRKIRRAYLEKTGASLLKLALPELFEILVKASGFTKEELLDKKRKSKMVDARTFIAYYLRARGLGVVEIGQLLNRDHSTVIHLLNKYDDLVFTRDPRFQSRLQEFNASLNKLL
jgi:chromosomal replication initiation ATPase DnaA